MFNDPYDVHQLLHLAVCAQQYLLTMNGGAVVGKVGEGRPTFFLPIQQFQLISRTSLHREGMKTAVGRRDERA